MKNIFQVNINNLCSLRTRDELHCRNPKIVKYGAETIFYFAPKIWYLVPEMIKTSKTLDIFKNKIRKWKPDFTLPLSKTYLQHVGFI